MEAIAKYDFKATADDELSFKRGDILKVSVGAKQMLGGLSLHSPTLCPDNTQRSHVPFLVAHFSQSPLCAIWTAEMDAEWNINDDLRGWCVMYGL